MRVLKTGWDLGNIPQLMTTNNKNKLNKLNSAKCSLLSILLETLNVCIRYNLTPDTKEPLKYLFVDVVLTLNSDTTEKPALSQSSESSEWSLAPVL